MRIVTQLICLGILFFIIASGTGMPPAFSGEAGASAPGGKTGTFQLEASGFKSPDNQRQNFFHQGMEEPSPSSPEKKPEEPFSLHLSAAPSEIPVGASGGLAVRFQIGEGFRLYADSIQITPEPAPGIVFGEIRRPEPLRLKEPDGKTSLFYEGAPVLTVPFRVEAGVSPAEKRISLKIRYQGCARSVCFLPEEKTLTALLTVLPAGSRALTDAPSDRMLSPIPPSVKEPPPPENTFERTARRFGFWGVLMAAFFWGFLASLTPCVYPMIPVTVSVIGAGSQQSALKGFVLSLFYVLGMSLTYAVLGATAAWTGSLFGAFSDHPAVRIGVALIFTVLALGMFDLIYIQMPSGVSSRLGGFSGQGRLGVFLTGAAAGAVVGPCVGPMLVGLLVYIASAGGKLQGFLIMWSFSLGMGMLFLAIGTFSGAAASLPKAGPWMERLKQIFGVLLLGAALYYLRPILPPNLFLLSLGALLAGVGVFLGGTDALKPDAGGYDRFRKTVGIVCLVLGVVYTARFALDDRRGAAVFPKSLPSETEAVAWIEDEVSALDRAGVEGRPLMIDFRADWCAACLKMEKETFVHPEVVRLTEDFVAVRIDNTDAEAPDAKRLREKYGVRGLPTLIFLRPDGRVISEMTVTEYMAPEPFRKRLKQVLALAVSGSVPKGG